MHKIRTQLYLTRYQHEMLVKIAKSLNTSISEIIRKVLDDSLAKFQTIDKHNPLSKIIGLGKSDISNGAINHDRDIYEQ